MKISNQTLWAKRKIGSLKTFHFPHLKYPFPKGGEQNHPLVNRANVDLDLKFISQMMKVIMRRGGSGGREGGEAPPENFDNLGWILTIFS